MCLVNSGYWLAKGQKIDLKINIFEKSLFLKKRYVSLWRKEDFYLPFFISMFFQAIPFCNLYYSYDFLPQGSQRVFTKYTKSWFFGVLCVISLCSLWFKTLLFHCYLTYFSNCKSLLFCGLNPIGLRGLSINFWFACILANARLISSSWIRVSSLMSL